MTAQRRARRIKKSAPQQIAFPATARAKILAELIAARSDVRVNDEQLASNIIHAISEELGIYEDVYDQLTEAIEPYVRESPPGSSHPNPFELPASVVGAMNILLAHWVATKR